MAKPIAEAALTQSGTSQAVGTLLMLGFVIIDDYRNWSLKRALLD
jgi:hypothetical protein